ncbi:UNVERIFIED_CONTAM: hypothetical protein FKN15_026468 [Acipenser sinensis]
MRLPAGTKIATLVSEVYAAEKLTATLTSQPCGSSSQSQESLGEPSSPMKLKAFGSFSSIPESPTESDYLNTQSSSSVSLSSDSEIREGEWSGAYSYILQSLSELKRIDSNNTSIKYYRLPEGTLQLAKICKILMAMETGRLSEFKGMKLDDIEIDPQEQIEEAGEVSASDDEPEPVGEPPRCADVKTLHAYLEDKQNEYQRALHSESSIKTFANLTKVTLSQVILFNRRREGEVAKMPLDAFTRRDMSGLHEDVAISLSELENKLSQHFTRLEIRGKRDRKVPVLLTPTMVAAMNLLVQKRGDCQVADENGYMFARAYVPLYCEPSIKYQFSTLMAEFKVGLLKKGKPQACVYTLKVTLNIVISMGVVSSIPFSVMEKSQKAARTVACFTF